MDEPLVFEDNENNMEIIENLFKSEEGRLEYAKIINSSVSSFMRNSIARQYCNTTLLSSGNIGVINNNYNTAIAIQREEGTTQMTVAGVECVIPTFEIAVYPSIKLTEFKKNPVALTERILNKSAVSLRKQEDHKFLELLSYGCGGENTLFFSEFADSPEDFWINFNKILRSSINNGNCFDTVLVPISAKSNPCWLKSRDEFKGLKYGYHDGKDINQVIFLDSSKAIGDLFIRHDVCVLPADDPVNLHFGWVIYYEIGMAINMECPAMNLIVPDENNFYSKGLNRHFKYE